MGLSPGDRAVNKTEKAMTFCSLDLVGKAGHCIRLQRLSKAQPPYPCVTAQETETEADKIPRVFGNKQEDRKCVGRRRVKDTSLRWQLCNDLKEVRRQPCSYLGKGKTRAETHRSLLEDQKRPVWPEQRNEGTDSGRWGQRGNWGRDHTRPWLLPGVRGEVIRSDEGWHHLIYTLAPAVFKNRLKGEISYCTNAGARGQWLGPG